MQSRVDVVIVHYNTAAMLRSCLEAVSAIGDGLLGRVVVVDNGSADPAVEQIKVAFPDVELICNRRNLGFAAACNKGIAAAESSYCLLLNPDAQIDERALKILLDRMTAHADAGVVAPRLINPDGSLQWSCRRYPTVPALLARGARLGALMKGPLDNYLMRDWDHGEVRTVDWVTGACLLLRRAALDEVGPLDERFFLYCEDIDLCRRMQLAGWKVYYEPAAIVAHVHRRESARLIPNRTHIFHLWSLLQVFRKHRFPLR